MYLHVLAEVGELLGLKDTKSSSYLLAMADFEDTLARTEQEMRATRAAVAESARRSQELEREWELLERTNQQLEAAADEREQRGASCSVCIAHKVRASTQTRCDVDPNREHCDDRAARSRVPRQRAHIRR